MGKAEEDLAFMRLYELRDRNNKWFVAAWKRLRELDPDFWTEYQREILKNDREISKLMGELCN